MKSKRPSPNRPKKKTGINTICKRLNKIIDRSNAIDEILSQYEKDVKDTPITPKPQKSASSPLKFESPNPKLSGSKPSNLYCTPIANQSPISSPHKTSESFIQEEENQVSLMDIYNLMLDLKQQVSQLAANQDEIKKEIKQLRKANC